VICLILLILGISAGTRLPGGKFFLGSTLFSMEIITCRLLMAFGRRSARPSGAAGDSVRGGLEAYVPRKIAKIFQKKF
jgi:hypothetical protein